MKWKLFFATLLLIFSGACINGGFADKTKDTSSDPECMEILDLLSIIEGFDYSEVGIAKTLFGDEKINFEVDTWRGKCYYGIGTLDGKVVIVSNKPFRDPTLLAFSDSKTVKMLFRNPDEKLFMEALRSGKIRIEGAGFTNSFKVGLTNTFGRFMLPKPEISEKLNITIPVFNLTSPQDYDGDGIENSQDKCDPYVLRDNLTWGESSPVEYYTCPTRLSSEGENYLGDAPYIDIYDYVMNDGCGVKDTDGGLRYYTRGSICIENVSYSEPRFYEGPFGQGIIYVPGKVYSQCERVYTDYCLDDKTLVEYYYEPPHRVLVKHPPFKHPLLGNVVDVVDVWLSRGVRNVTIECPFGCSMGACIVKDVDSPPEELFFGPSVVNGEVRYGWNPRSKGYYGQGQEEYVALKTGKNKNDISDQDYFGDECIDDKTLREYYLTVGAFWDVGGIIADRVVMRSDEERCSYSCIDGKCIGRGDLRIVSAEPVQVVYGAPLIKGKGTAFRIIVDSTFESDLDVEVELELPDNEWYVSDTYSTTKWTVRIPANANNYEIMLPPLSNTRIVRGDLIISPSLGGPMLTGLLNLSYRDVPRPSADRVSFKVRIDPSNSLVETNEGNNEISVNDIEVKTTKPFKVMYFIHVPNSSYIDQSNGIIKCSVQNCKPCKNCSDVRIGIAWDRVVEIVESSTHYLLGVAPVADTKMQFAINFSINVQSDYGGNSKYWKEILRLAKSWGYDAAISIDPCDYCGVSNVWDGNDYVCNIGGAPRSQSPTVAHELLSHEILKFDKECYGCIPYANGSRNVTSCPKCDVDCDSCVASDGFWVNKWRAYEGGRWVQTGSGWKIEGAKYYACSVSPEDITWQRLDRLWKWSDGSQLPGGYLDLIDEFEDQNDPAVLIVSGTVYKNGSAEFDPYFEIVEGVVDAVSNTVGDYYIVLLDSEGNTLNKYSFTPSFELMTHEGTVYTDQSSFVFRILWDDKIKRIELQDRNGNALAYKLISPNKPEIWITSPRENDVFGENETILIKWNAKDLDGDTLSFSIGLSQNKENWIPVASHLKNEEYAIETNSLSRGYYWIKVRVTDGINTAEAISGRFFVDVPEVEQQKEICGNEFCNLNFENFASCPQDCPTGIKDGVCDAAKDNRVDPDCRVGEDPDDTVNYEMKIAEEHKESDLLIYGMLFGGLALIIGVLVGIYKIFKRKRR